MHARGPAEDREGATALRLRLVVAAEPQGRPAVLGHGLGVAGGVDAVLEGDGAHASRREERAKLVSHGLPHRASLQARSSGSRFGPSVRIVSKPSSTMSQ